MNLNAIRKRIEVLEATAAMRRDDGDGEDGLLSPADVALLWIERLMTHDDSPENIEKTAKIDALLKSHCQACARRKPEPMPPDVMEAAMRDAVRREAEPNYYSERLDALLEIAT